MLNQWSRPFIGPAVLFLSLLWTSSVGAQGPSCCGASDSPVLQDQVPAQQPPSRRVLRISADPNNLPFTNQRLEGFENKIAELLAREMDAELQYIWRAQRRGFFRQALKEGECDLVLGAPTGFEMALTTKPYYRSTYVFVSREDRGLKVRSFDDPLLRDLRIGVHMIGDDGANTPPAHALAARGIIDNVVGYTIYGDYAQENPPARIIDAVASGEIDLAAIWGPLAGYFAKRQPVELKLTAVSPERDSPILPFVFSISMAVRRGDEKFKEELNELLERNREEIDRILEEYRVPRVPVIQTTSAR